MWADMDAATPLGAWGRSVISLPRAAAESHLQGNGAAIIYNGAAIIYNGSAGRRLPGAKAAIISGTRSSLVPQPPPPAHAPDVAVGPRPSNSEASSELDTDLLWAATDLLRFWDHDDENVGKKNTAGPHPLPLVTAAAATTRTRSHRSIATNTTMSGPMPPQYQQTQHNTFFRSTTMNQDLRAARSTTFPAPSGLPADMLRDSHANMLRGGHAPAPAPLGSEASDPHLGSHLDLGRAS